MLLTRLSVDGSPMCLDDLSHPQRQVIVERLEVVALRGLVEESNDPLHSTLQLVKIVCLAFLLSDAPQALFDKVDDILDQREIWRVGGEGEDVKAQRSGESCQSISGRLGSVDWRVVLLPDKSTVAKVRLRNQGYVLVQNRHIAFSLEALCKNLRGNDASLGDGQPQPNRSSRLFKLGMGAYPASPYRRPRAASVCTCVLGPD